MHNNAHRMSPMDDTATWRGQGYADGLRASSRLLEPNPTDYHPDYVRGFRQAWADRDDAAPALQAISDDRPHWMSRAGGAAYDHRGERLGDPSDDSIRARISDGLAVHVHDGMTAESVEQELIKARRKHAAIK